MDSQYWNYIVTFVGLIGFWLGGKKIWWSWYINIANQVLWFTFGLVTHQWGFVVGTFFYTPVFIRNAYLWTSEHRAEKVSHNPRFDPSLISTGPFMPPYSGADVDYQLFHTPGIAVEWGRRGPIIGEVKPLTKEMITEARQAARSYKGVEGEDCQSFTHWQGREVGCEVNAHPANFAHQHILYDAIPALKLSWYQAEAPIAEEINSD